MGKMLNETFLYSFFFPFPDLRRRSAAFPDRFRWHRDVASSRNSCSVCVSVSVVCVCVCVILLYEAGPRANIKLASIFLSTRFKLWQTTRLDKPKWKEKQKRKNNILSTVLFPLVYFLKRYKTHIFFFFLKTHRNNFILQLKNFIWRNLFYLNFSLLSR